MTRQKWCIVQQYWNENNMNVYLETFANLTVIDVLGTNGSEEFKGILKELFNAYKEITK